MDCQVRLVEGYPDDELVSQLKRLASEVTGFDFPFFQAQLQGREKVLCCFAFSEELMIGYKIGFQDKPGYFESWIGGVDPKYRRKGVASALINAQHDWCRNAGFRIVSTINEGDNRAMLIANLRAGFEICGTFWDRRSILKVMLQKFLQERPKTGE